MMHLTKDNPIIVTKVPYTPEEFLQKKIELLVDIYSETSRFLLCFFCSSFVNRKMTLNRSMLLISKMFVINIFDGLL